MTIQSTVCLVNFVLSYVRTLFCDTGLSSRATEQVLLPHLAPDQLLLVAFPMSSSFLVVLWLWWFSQFSWLVCWKPHAWKKEGKKNFCLMMTTKPIAKGAVKAVGRMEGLSCWSVAGWMIWGSCSMAS